VLVWQAVTPPRSLHAAAHLAALHLLGILAACQGAAPDPCAAYQAYDNIIHDAAEWNSFVDSGCTIVRGHLTLLAGAADPSNVPLVEEVTGGLGIALGGSSREVALPHLRSIGGSLLVTSSAAQEAIHLPALTSTGGFVGVSGNDALRVVDLPVLASIGWGHVQVVSNGSLEALDLPALMTPISLQVDQNAVLTRLSLPALPTLGYVTLARNGALASVDLAALTEVLDGMALMDLPALPVLDLPTLQSVGTVQYAAGLTIHALPSLTRVSMPALRSVGFSFDVSGNRVLHTLEIPKLDQVGSLTIVNNPAYPECLATALADHLVASCGLQSAMVGGNDTASTCGP
jgi:hypothetical protein